MSNYRSPANPFGASGQQPSYGGQQPSRGYPPSHNQAPPRYDINSFILFRAGYATTIRVNDESIADIYILVKGDQDLVRLRKCHLTKASPGSS